MLFQVVNQRYLRCRPMVFTTNKPLAAWADVLHDADLAEAIIDRVLARGRILELRGPSYRTRHIKPPHLPPEVRAGVSGKVVPEFPEPTVGIMTDAPGVKSPADGIGAGARVWFVAEWLTPVRLDAWIDQWDRRIALPSPPT